jgi:glycosyltransferase involved in cell wall biosynthesis
MASEADRAKRARRVLVVVNDLGAGGAQRAALEQAAALDPERFEVELASLEIESQRGWNEERFRHVPIRRLRPPGASLARSWAGLREEISRFEPHLVHNHLAVSGLFGTLTARALGVPRVVTTFHNLTDWQEKRFHPLRVAARRAFQLCDRLVAVSHAVRTAMGAVSSRLEARTEVIHNGVDLASFRNLGAQREQERARLGFESSDFVVGAVARFDRRKGLDLLIEAASLARPRLPELKLLLVGDGVERPRLEAQIRDLGLESAVRCPGACSDVGPFLAAMDLFAAPSRTEGQGIAIVEAMAAGLPVLASRVGGIPEVVADGVCGRLLPSGAKTPWSAALVDLGTRPEERRRLALQAPARAAAFSLEAAAERIERLYGVLLETPRSLLRTAA